MAMIYIYKLCPIFICSPNTYTIIIKRSQKRIINHNTFLLKNGGRNIEKMGEWNAALDSARFKINASYFELKTVQFIE